MKISRPLVLLALSAAVFGCGQKGPLVLPDAQHPPHKKVKFPGAPKPPAVPAAVPVSPAPPADSPTEPLPAPSAPVGPTPDPMPPEPDPAPQG